MSHSAAGEDDDAANVAMEQQTGLIQEERRSGFVEDVPMEQHQQNQQQQQVHQQQLSGDDQELPLYIAAPSFDEDDDDADDGDASSTKERGPCTCYLPSSCGLINKCKGSLRLAFLSHACFIVGSFFYVALSLSELSWAYMAIEEHNVPDDVFEMDDDVTWADWESQQSGSEGTIVEDIRTRFNFQYTWLYAAGATCFVLVGLLDWMRYCDIFNVFMILAGLAGVTSAMSDTSFEADIWDCISVHMYLLEAVNLLHREHEYEGHPMFRLGDVCFLGGCILDVMISYFSLAGFDDIWLIYVGLTSAILWVLCSLVDVSAEIYFLRKHTAEIDGGEGSVASSIFCY